MLGYVIRIQLETPDREPPSRWVMTFDTKEEMWACYRLMAKALGLDPKPQELPEFKSLEPEPLKPEPLKPE